MKGDELIRKLVVRAPRDLMAAIYERERLREGQSWPDILGVAQELGILTPEEAWELLQYFGDRRRDVA